MNLICVMPLGDGQTIHPEVYKSLLEQTVTIHLMPLTRPVEHFELPGVADVFKKKIRTGRKSISITRNLIKHHLNKVENYLLHIDSDVVLSTNHDVEDMIKFLDENPRVAVVGLNTKNFKLENVHAGHVSMACLLFRKEILKNYVFHNGKYERDCNCQMLTNEVRQMVHPDRVNWEIRYLDSRQLREVDRLVE